MMTREEAEKELIAMLEEAEGGPSYSIEEVDAYMRDLSPLLLASSFFTPLLASGDTLPNGIYG